MTLVSCVYCTIQVLVYVPGTEANKRDSVPYVPRRFRFETRWSTYGRNRTALTLTGTERNPRRRAEGANDDGTGDTPRAPCRRSVGATTTRADGLGATHARLGSAGTLQPAPAPLPPHSNDALSIIQIPTSCTLFLLPLGIRIAAVAFNRATVVAFKSFEGVTHKCTGIEFRRNGGSRARSISVRAFAGRQPTAEERIRARLESAETPPVV